MINSTYKNNCQQFFELLIQNDIKFWLMAGTLLGAVRERNFINHDADIDIAIWIEDKQKFLDVIKNSDWQFFQIWRREIGITRHGFERSQSKIDVFLMDKDDKFAYLYSYMKNHFSPVWDTEWRIKFPIQLFNEIIPYNISDIKCFIPKEAEKILALHYTKDWQTPDIKWNNAKIPSVDIEYKELAIIIPTFLRDDKLKILINSISSTIDNKKYRLYIADQGIFSLEKEEYYNQLRRKGHQVYYLPFNCGLSYSRNFLISKISEPYVLLVDDDFYFTKETNIQNFIYILNSRDSLGVVGGKLKNRNDYHFKLYQSNNKLYYIKLNPKEWYYTPTTYLIKPIRFLYSDIVLNFALFKKELFNDQQWNNELKMAEHTYFYWQLKQLKKWDVAFTDTVIATHQNETNSSIYNDFRKKINKNLGLDLLYKKMNLTKDDYITIEDK